MRDQIKKLASEAKRVADSGSDRRPMKILSLRTLSLVFLACGFGSAWSQQPVYLCAGVYTDKPCKEGREVDINPTRGAHSLSGQRRESHEAVMERVSRDIEKAQARGLKQGMDAMRCEELRRQRVTIDASGRTDMKDQRFAIREEQFRLKCKRT